MRHIDAAPTDEFGWVPQDFTPPHGFVHLPGPGKFIGRSADYFIRRQDDGNHSLGTLICEGQSNTQGFAHGGFLMTFADFAMTIITMGITINLTADFIRPVKVGEWIEAQVVTRKRTANLIFADAMATTNGREVLRMSGVFKPVPNRAP
ncbi:PaaI family thioesterase [Sphingomonas montanisoli]|uniref:PaaI family thioesterase n=1 Tax=Sphingomonas montanisoli TaxID=2606412 RepID=A0A5D9C463_9SPHN|nr:PaaI family thioesterase [Sphingomonas montanisoli]TZG24715.1 PaaI family thioesterase [Sphingomonas montanisoli]